MVAIDSKSRMIPSLSLSKLTAAAGTTSSLGTRTHTRTRSHGKETSKDASDVDILAIPDPPTPDDRNHFKTSAAALEMRRKRRKSRGLSGYGGSLLPGSSSNGTDRLEKNDVFGVPDAPFVDVTNNSVINPMQDQLRRAGLVSAAPSEEHLKVSNQDEKQTEIIHAQGMNDDSNMDLEDEAESFDLEDGDHDSDSKPTICFDDSDDDVIDMKPSAPTQNSNDSSVRKRPRQSMLIPNQNDLQGFLGIEERDEVLEAMASPAKRIKLGSPYDDETAPSHGKRNKGRRSLLLPSELLDLDDKESSVSSIEASSATEGCQPKSSSSSNGSGSVRSAEENMDEIKAAIRRFCAMPMEERYKSNDALRVEELTGYPLLTAMDKVNRQRMENGTISTPIKLSWAQNDGKMSPGELASLSNELKRNLFEKIKPLVRIMEFKKNECTAMLEDSTKCRVERKKGKFRYISLATGKKVSSKEYERRYLLQIQELRDAKMIAMYATMPLGGNNNTANRQDKEIIEVEKIDTQDQEDRDTVPFPSRYEVPSDPGLAAAQCKLFELWDLALDEYTETVLDIRSNKRKMEEK